MKVHLITCKAYYTDGDGWMVKVFSTKKKAAKYIRSLSTGVRYNKEDDWYDDQTNQYLYKIHPLKVEE